MKRKILIRVILFFILINNTESRETTQITEATISEIKEKIEKLYNKRDFTSIKEAEKEANKLNIDNIKNPLLLALISNLYSNIAYREWQFGINTDKLDKAEKYAYKARQLSQEEYYGYKAMGNVLLTQGRRKEALDNFQKAIDMNENDPELWYFFACASNGSITDRYSLAGQRIQRTLEVDPLFIWAKEDLFYSFILEKNLVKAEKILNDMIKNHPYYGNNLFLQGLLFLKKGSKKEAYIKFKEFEKNNPDTLINKFINSQISED
ncbi:MAG: hypothetical protein OEZ22_13855 [Spirochaetia bacterium]|nr:hypothetical protein [Spirochaetia bacterium]